MGKQKWNDMALAKLVSRKRHINPASGAIVGFSCVSAYLLPFPLCQVFLIEAVILLVNKVKMLNETLSMIYAIQRATVCFNSRP